MGELDRQATAAAVLWEGERVPKESISVPNWQNLQTGLHRLGQWELKAVSRRGKCREPVKEMKVAPGSLEGVGGLKMCV